MRWRVAREAGSRQYADAVFSLRLAKFGSRI